MDKVTEATNELIFLNGYTSGILAERNGRGYNKEDALKEFYGLRKSIDEELARETRQEKEKESRREDEEDIHDPDNER